MNEIEKNWSDELYRRLCSINKDLIRPWGDPDFIHYGQKVSIAHKKEIEEWFSSHYNPDGPVYVPHYDDSRYQTWKTDLENQVFGGMSAQVGSCCGGNTRMNGMEYHKGHEIIIALTPLVLFLGYTQDLHIDFTGKWTWDSSQGEFFFIPAGESVELFSTTLHLAPCRVMREDFKSLIILPAGTNLELDVSPDEGDLLFKKNKWMICHPDSPAAANGAYPGITGSNRSIIPVNSDE